MDKSCIRHLVRCRCILAQFKRSPDSPAYEFAVFSEVIDNEVQAKLVACPNCGIVHKIVDACTSEILNRDDMRTMTSIDDIKISLSPTVIAALEKHEVDISIWENVRWIVENDRWGSFVPLEQESVPGGKNVKIMIILGSGIFRVETKFVANSVK